jgi:hypothetical protein
MNAILNALLKVIENDPKLVEELVEALLKMILAKAKAA